MVASPPNIRQMTKNWLDLWTYRISTCIREPVSWIQEITDAVAEKRLADWHNRGENKYYLYVCDHGNFPTGLQLQSCLTLLCLHIFHQEIFKYNKLGKIDGAIFQKVKIGSTVLEMPKLLLFTIFLLIFYSII